MSLPNDYPQGGRCRVGGRCTECLYQIITLRVPVVERFDFTPLVFVAAGADPEGVDWVASHPPLLKSPENTNEKQHLVCT